MGHGNKQALDRTRSPIRQSRTSRQVCPCLEFVPVPEKLPRARSAYQPRPYKHLFQGYKSLALTTPDIESPGSSVSITYLLAVSKNLEIWRLESTRGWGKRRRRGRRIKRRGGGARRKIERREKRSGKEKERRRERRMERPKREKPSQRRTTQFISTLKAMSLVPVPFKSSHQPASTHIIVSVSMSYV